LTGGQNRRGEKYNTNPNQKKKKRGGNGTMGEGRKMGKTPAQSSVTVEIRKERCTSRDLISERIKSGEGEHWKKNGAVTYFRPNKTQARVTVKKNRQAYK